MKYVHDHANTTEALKSWAGSYRLVTARYYFWNAGLPLQKSQIGLLQTLLYQVLLACPDLISKIGFTHRSTEPWSQIELSNAFEAISQQPSLPIKFCFFVDGLDEYEGDDEDIIQLLQGLATSPSIKICISSRPWNSFLDAFDNSRWKLVLEDLTKDDMLKYVQNILVENEIFAKVAIQDQRCNGLVPQIAEKAHGVWLWVYLVVRDLLRDLRGEEEYPLLQRRLDNFPDELEKYFENIINRIDKIHRAETARIFLVAVEAVQPLPIVAFKYLSMEQEDPSYAINSPVTSIPLDDAFELLVRKWKRLLNSRCRDFLEVTKDSEDTFLKYKVDFLHRTVRDFLRDNYRRELRKRTSEHFNERLSLCNILLALSKALPQSEDPRQQLNQSFGLVDEMMHYAREMERQSGTAHAVLLDELDRVNTVHAFANNYKSHWTNMRDSPTPAEVFREYGQCSFLALAIQSRLSRYVNEKLDAHPEILREKHGRPYLDYALRPKRVTPAELPYQLQHEDANIDPQMVRSLLTRGSDPNQTVHIYPGYTIWKLFLLFCYENADKASLHLKDAWYDAMVALIEYRADQEAQIANPADPQVKTIGTTARYRREIIVKTDSGHLTVSDVLRAVFPPDRAERLHRRMAEVAQQRQSQTSIWWRMLGWR
jgi:hypothetical protein